jgi:hypothetical protein
MLDFDVQTLVLIVAAASARQRRQAIDHLREQLPELAARHISRWLDVDRRQSSEPWLSLAEGSEQAAGVQQMLEQLVRAFPGYWSRRYAHVLLDRGAGMPGGCERSWARHACYRSAGLDVS